MLCLSNQRRKKTIPPVRFSLRLSIQIVCPHESEDFGINENLIGQFFGNLLPLMHVIFIEDPFPLPASDRAKNGSFEKRASKEEHTFILSVRLDSEKLGRIH